MLLLIKISFFNDRSVNKVDFISNGRKTNYAFFERPNFYLSYLIRLTKMF